MTDASAPSPPPVPVRLATLHWGVDGARDSGGPRVLLLHGLPSAAGTWWRIASELADRGWSVTAPDLRGHGLSPRSTRYRLTDYAADVLALVPGSAGSDGGAPGAAAPTGRPWDLVVGHSLGGAVAVVAAASDPAWARRLLLIDPVLALGDDEAEQILPDLLADLHGDRLDPGALLREHPLWHVEDAVQKVNAARVVSPFVVERTLRDNAGTWQLEAPATTLAAPVHVLAADPALGASFTAEQGERMHAAASSLSYTVVDGAGHSVHRDDPARVIDEAVALLA
ncbi:alpha/beta fold hydrolase [Herbiconiux sp. A18JL235]|uniref:Alpha/beta fold hydrolase n=1 Tax=Herbiconiux sp. A18JL235 TaxID=3152363 RepID=A0AB39BD16_9MICO